MGSNMNKWWKSNEKLFTFEQELMSQYYPSLKLSIKNGFVTYSGLLNIKDIDTYHIQIILPNDYPNNIPIVFEIGGDIPKVLNRHINDNGSCCLTINDEIKTKYKKDYFLKDFLDDFVNPYFANQLYYEQTGNWLNGEYSHGMLGKWEYLTDKTNIQNNSLLLNFIRIAEKNIPNLNKKCPCKSNKPLKKCHLNTVLQIKRILPNL